MNLVLSGPIDDNLRNEVAASVKPHNVVRLHAKAYRFEGADDSAQMRARIATLCDASRVDHAYVEEGKRFSDFKLLAMDMDSTLITIECIDEIADFAGKKKEVAAITEAAMRGEIPDFAESLRRRVALLAGTQVNVLQKVYDERLKLTSGARELIASAKSAGLSIAVLTGGFRFFSERISADLGLDYTCGNSLEIRDGRMTGHIRGPIIDDARKSAAIKALLPDCAPPLPAITIGDGANDLSMMRVSRLSISYHGKPAVRNIADWHINYGDLHVVCDWLNNTPSPYGTPLA